MTFYCRAMNYSWWFPRSLAKVTMETLPAATMFCLSLTSFPNDKIIIQKWSHNGCRISFIFATLTSLHAYYANC